jgi:hypothetical protein
MTERDDASNSSLRRKPDVILIVIDTLKRVVVGVTLAATQATIDLELSERDRFAFGPCRSGPLKELVDQEVRMAFFPSMTGIDGQNLHWPSLSSSSSCIKIFRILPQTPCVV